jgi:poly-beta-1,6-N-acetyl-D-glucosamine synthase
MTIPERCTIEQPHCYVLMTAAHNEEAHIEQTMRSVVSQSVPPHRWVIISDNSIDKTDEIVRDYAERHAFIRLLRIDRPAGRNFGAKVRALHRGYQLVENVAYRYIGNLDADITVGPTYFETLIHCFERQPAMGVAGGFLYEEQDGQFASCWNNSTHDVFHAAQLVRRECYEAIGGYSVLKYGGEDWLAQTLARMKGWKVEALSDLAIFHHRHAGAGDPHVLRDRFRLGLRDHSFGSDPLFEILKCLRRVPEKPIMLGAMARMVGFCWGYISGKHPGVSDEIVAYLRQEQRSRMGLSFRGQRPGDGNTHSAPSESRAQRSSEVRIMGANDKA